MPAPTPHATQVQIPAVSALGAVRIARWRVQVGQAVVANETLVLLETATGPLELPAPASGTVLALLHPVGARLSPGTPIATLDLPEHGTRLFSPLDLPSAVRNAVPAAALFDPEVQPTLGEAAPRGGPSPIVLTRPVTRLPAQPLPIASDPTARRLAGFGTTVFTEMTRLAQQHNAVNLAQGFPDFDGPQFAREAAIAAIQAGHNQYAPMAGLPALREAIARRAMLDQGLAWDPDSEITVYSGATEGLFVAVQALCDVGDEVIVLEPFYDAYRAAVLMAGAIPRVVTLHGPDWHLDEAELARAFTSRTRLLILNTPHNPTGKVFDTEELTRIAALCLKHGVVVISDEVYEHLVFEGTHVSIATLPGMRERTVTLSSVGKTFSLTGWKVGWSLAPASLTRAMRTAHQFVTFAVATPMQHGAATALAAPPSYFVELRRTYREKRDLLAEGLVQAGFRLRPQQGTYFLCAETEQFGRGDDVAVCRWLTTEVGVAAIPPSAFYDRTDEGRSYVRFAFCKRTETLAAALERLGRLTAR